MQAAERAAQASMNELVGEIRNSIQYFASLPGRLPVSRVLITGGGSELHGLVGMLEGQVRLPVLQVSPFARLDISKLDLSEEQANEVGPVLATPIGLALPEPDKAVKKFNLIPPEVARRMRMKKIQERTLVGSVAVVIAPGPLRWLEALPGPQRSERCQHPAGEHRLAQRPSAQVRPRGRGPQRLLRRRRPTGVGAQFGRRLAPGPQQLDLDHPLGGEGPDVRRRVPLATAAGAAPPVRRSHRCATARPRPVAPARRPRPRSGPSSSRSPVRDQASPSPKHGSMPSRARSLRQPPPGEHRGQPETAPSRSPSRSRSHPMPASTRMRA